jgi:hypothetical protein
MEFLAEFHDHHRAEQTVYQPQWNGTEIITREYTARQLPREYTKKIDTSPPTTLLAAIMLILSVWPQGNN